ncbi:trypsin-like peptidase domain-containing protein [Mesorhizobium sp. AaZ16]|uniref:trypsin-like peptidase domain-containing protein n=1 Tax=Mesorhizobium sp. AaZ16 TaxID=3402289 RepID=UPI00374FD957
MRSPQRKKKEERDAKVRRPNLSISAQLLIRLDQSFGGLELFFCEICPILGEFAVSLGYRLSGLLGSGPQVWHGLVSGLLGPGDDPRPIQISAPIQPGSSGGRAFDSSGLLIGLVTATLVRTECQFCDSNRAGRRFEGSGWHRCERKKKVICPRSFRVDENGFQI